MGTSLAVVSSSAAAPAEWAESSCCSTVKNEEDGIVHTESVSFDLLSDAKRKEPCDWLVDQLHQKSTLREG